jgi:hypothetical protein
MTRTRSSGNGGEDLARRVTHVLDDHSHMCVKDWGGRYGSYFQVDPASTRAVEGHRCTWPGRDHLIASREGHLLSGATSESETETGSDATSCLGPPSRLRHYLLLLQRANPRCSLLGTSIPFTASSNSTHSHRARCHHQPSHSKSQPISLPSLTLAG